MVHHTFQGSDLLYIWRNGPYIGGHLAFFFQIEFQTRV